MVQGLMVEEGLTIEKGFEEKVTKPDELLQTFSDEGCDINESERTSSPSLHKCSAKPKWVNSYRVTCSDSHFGIVGGDNSVGLL